MKSLGSTSWSTSSSSSSSSPPPSSEQQQRPPLLPICWQMSLREQALWLTHPLATPQFSLPSSTTASSTCASASSAAGASSVAGVSSVLALTCARPNTVQPHVNAEPGPDQRWHCREPAQSLHFTVPLSGFPPLLPICWQMSLREQALWLTHPLATPQV